ncbi:TrkH family potassium uptake protein [Synergistaceae bacterium OttesenSCG-928-I11]|nr:TrkH family potassium uptake protein [Synergistaceae bacterium OttesenSCG-928-I11]
MRVCVVVRFLGFLMIVISLWMICPFVYAVSNAGEDTVPFALSIGIGIFSGAVLYFLGRGVDMSKMRAREAMASVALSWIAASAVSGLPYFFHGSAPTYADAFFEAMSGFTTTGSTILQDIDAVPRGLLLWRGLTHWLGGMGIIVLTLTMMPILGVGGFNLFTAEVPGVVHEKITPRVRQTAVILWLIYIGLTLIQTIILLLGGMGIFDAITHAMGTISTGGFSPHDESMAYFDNAFYDWVVTFFMFISGANFVLHYQAIRGRSLRSFFRDPEFAFYFLCVLSLSLLTSLGLYMSGTSESIHQCLRHGAFQVTSLITTTGFVTTNYEIWPFFSQSLLFVCLFLGGCAGSTSGGIKQIRLLILFRHAARQLTRILNPRAVLPLRIGKKAMDLDAISSTLAFFGLYLLVFVVGIFGITLFEPDFFTAISGVAATLGNVGPGFGTLGAAGNFASQAAGAKWIYSFLMLCGRLELYTVLILFSRPYWNEGVILSKD